MAANAEDAREKFEAEAPDRKVVACEAIDISDIPLRKPLKEPLWALAFEDPDPSQFIQDADPIGKATREARDLWMTVATDPEQLSTGISEGDFICPACKQQVMLKLPPVRVRRRPGFGPIIYSNCPKCQTKLYRHQRAPRDAWQIAEKENRANREESPPPRLGEGLSQRRSCVFCGAEDQKISKEHLWSKWMRAYVEGGEGGSIGKSRILATDTGKIKKQESWQEEPFGQEVSGPCKKCNEGWMEHLEDEARPYLIPMLLNEKVLLRPEAQRTVARWATLKLLVAHLGHSADQQHIPINSYRRFYVDRSLPNGAQVWLGRYNGAGAWPTDYNYQGLFMTMNGGQVPEHPNAYLAGFSIGYLAFFYWGHELHQGPVADIRRVASYLTSIWPATGTARWPPLDLLDADGLRFVLKRFPTTGWI